MDSILATLKESARRHEKIYFRPNPGNAGDSLLNVGFYSIVEKLNLEIEEVTNDFSYDQLGKDDLLVLSGGGNIVPYWDSGSEIIVKLTKYSFPLLLMPQSIEGREDVLRLLRKDDTLFLRERYSYEYAKSLGLSCEIKLDHDLAFFTDLSFLKEKGNLRLALRSGKAKRLLKVGYHFVRSRFNKKLAALRTDQESKLEGHKKLKLNDISRVTRLGTHNKEANFLSAYWFLKVLSWYEVVETDRLHVLIGCVLVGTKVILYENSYHKIKGVYDFSIASFNKYNTLVEFDNYV